MDKFLFLGSSCIYPKFSNQPITEEELLSGNLEKQINIAIAKIAGIKLCEALAIQEGFNAICLMPTNLYGPGDNYHEYNSHVFCIDKEIFWSKNWKLKSNMLGRWHPSKRISIRRWFSGSMYFCDRKS